MLSRQLGFGNAFRTFSTSHALYKTLSVPKKPLTPLSTEKLVSYTANYYKPQSLSELQPLREARELYAKIHIHNWDLLVTEGDVVKLPVNFKDVKLGDTLRFDEVSQIGSRNHVVAGERIDPSVFDITGTVIEKTRVKRQITEKTRRRRRHVRHVVSNNSLTVFRINKISLN